jgi:hypothetical protein
MKWNGIDFKVLKAEKVNGKPERLNERHFGIDYSRKVICNPRHDGKLLKDSTFGKGSHVS